jgi:disulfide oxidoreductase YuzD
MIDYILEARNKRKKGQIIFRDNSIDRILDQAEEYHLEAQKAQVEIEKLKELLLEGFELSAYAAAVNFDGSKNTKEWCDGLAKRIDDFQEKCETTGAVDTSEMYLIPMKRGE